MTLRNKAAAAVWAVKEVTAGTTEVQAVNENPKRLNTTLVNVSDATVHFGPEGVTTSNGLPLEVNAPVTLTDEDAIAEVYIIAGAASKAVRVLESTLAEDRV